MQSRGLILNLSAASLTFQDLGIGGNPPLLSLRLHYSATTSLVTLDMYRVAMQDFDIGAASALGICFLIALPLVMSWLLRLLASSTDLLDA